MPPPTRVALLGAGHIGQTIARLLAGSGDYQVTLIDRSAAALGRVRGAGISNLVADTEQHAALLAALQAGGGHQVVVNALPYHLAVTTATTAREAGCHYFDLTEDVAATRAIKALCPESSSTPATNFPAGKTASSSRASSVSNSAASNSTAIAWCIRKSCSKRSAACAMS